MQIDEFVRVNVHGTFHSDVQVSAYRDPEANLQLAKSYIFTSAAAGQEVGSVELLEAMVAGYLPGRAPNRLMAIATFGHGKSHFAVAAATFFGRPKGTASLDAVLAGLDHAITDPARVERLKTFKANRRPFLVVLLRGDEPGDLPSKFSRAMDEALRDHPGTAGVRPPFWFTEAERFLDRITDGQHEIADRVLEEQGFDLPSLREKILQRDDQVYDVCRELYRSLTGVYPDFQGATNLRQLVEWAADELCGHEGPAGGVLILFDEFSTFVRSYGAGHPGRHASPLQDLLNGVQGRRERVEFVALGQVDPRTVAKEFAGARLDNMIKELDRIETWLRLRSVLEEVLDSYLKQEVRWEQLAPGDPLRRAVEQSTAATWRLFTRRYDRELRWSQEDLIERVGWGCFPLHPMTTALFSTIDYSATSNPRSVLQFVISALDKRAGQPALVGDEVSWVPPYELVDYFGEMLDPRAWEQYEEVIRALGGDITDPQGLVLKALLLITAAKVPTRDVGFSEAIASFAGLALSKSRETLLELHQRGFIRRDEVVGSYAFWPIGGGAYRVEQVLRRMLQDVPTVTEHVLAEAERSLRVSALLRDLEVPTPFGHAEDWTAAQELVLARSFSDPNRLRQVAARLFLDPAALVARRPAFRRSALVWIIPESEGDVAWCREELPKIVDEAFGDADVPLVLMRPVQTVPQVLDLIRRVYAVQRFPADDVREVSEQQLREIRTQSIVALSDAIAGLRGTSEALVPRAFRGDVAELKNASRYEVVLDAVYRRAFREGPGEFFPSHKVSSSRFGTTVIAVGQALYDDSVGDQTALMGSDKVARDLVDKVLVPKWGVLGTEHRLQAPPEGSPVRPAWQALDEAFPPGCTGQPVAPLLSRLLNPPYGYDSRTLTLLLAAWYGWHRRELSLSADGKITGLETLLKGDARNQKKTTPSEFTLLLSRAALTRQDEAEIERVVKSTLDQVERGTAHWTQEGAEEAIRTIRQFAGMPRANESTKRRMASAVRRLEESLELARSYDATVAELLATAGRWQEEKPERLVEASRAVKTLRLPELIEVVQPDQVEIARVVQDALARRVEQLCCQWEQLTDPERHYTQQSDLVQLAKQLREFPDLSDRAREGLKRLEVSKKAAEQRIAAEHHDERLRAELSGLATGPDVGVATLEGYLDRLSAMEPFGEALKLDVARKRQLVLSALETIRGRVRGLPARLASAKNGDEVRTIRDEVVMLVARVLGSELEDEVAEAQDRCDALLMFFEKLEPLAASEPNTPKDVERAEVELSRLERHDSVLSVSQRALLVAASERIASHVRDREAKAVAWLDALRDDLAGEHDPWELDRQAQLSPTFLPASEGSRLEEIRARISAEKDRDARRQIAELFEGIADERERQEIAREIWEQAFGDVPMMASSR